MTEQNDRQRWREREREREREFDLSNRKRRFQATSSFTFDRFVLNGPCSRHGFEIDKNSRPFKTLSANRPIQDFFKVWKRLLKIQDLFKTLRPACEPCYTFLSCFYASVFNWWSCFSPDSITAVGGGEIQNMEANTAPPVFSEPYHSASPMQQNVPALFLLSSLAFFSRTILHNLFASSLNSFRQNLQKYPGYFITRSR